MPDSSRLFRPAHLAEWDLTSDGCDQLLTQYRNGLADGYDTSEFDPELPFFSESRVFQFEKYVLIRSRSVGQRLSRTQAEIRRSGLDCLAIILDLSGMQGDANGRTFNTPAGTVHLRDLARPSNAKVESLDLIVLAIPRDAAPEWLVTRDFHGLSIESSLPLGNLLAENLITLMKLAHRLSLEEGVAAIEAALTLAQQALITAGHFSAPQSQDRNSNLRAAAKEFVDSRLSDQSLNVSELVEGLGVSRATLFRAFGSSGGVGLYIKHRRLKLAREALFVRVGHRPSIGEIAHAHGFSGTAYFSRAFKQRYGQAPGQLQPIKGPATVLEASGAIRYDLVRDWLAHSG